MRMKHSNVMFHNNVMFHCQVVRLRHCHGDRSAVYSFRELEKELFADYEMPPPVHRCLFLPESLLDLY